MNGEYNSGAGCETSAVDVLGGGRKSVRMQTRRERLEYQKQQLMDGLAVIDKAIAALDAHPELEEFIDTLARAGG